MDLSAWISIVALVLAVPLGVASHLLTFRFVSFLERRKLIKAEKTKQQALQVYKRIKAFHDGTKDRYAYYLLLASAAIICAISASTLILVIALQNTFPLAILVILAALAALVTSLLLIGIYETARQLERFDDYKKEFVERWGPIDD